MKKNRIFGLATAALLLGAAACSNETLVQDPGQATTKPSEQGSGVYLSVDFKMPTGAGTRSKTEEGGGSNDGTEVGLPAENTVSSALIVLAATEEKVVTDLRIDKFGFIAAGEVPSNRISTYITNPPGYVTGTQYKATARLQKENLETLYKAYSTTGEGGTIVQGQIPYVYVFVFANPTTDLINLFDAEVTPLGSASWIDATCNVIQSVDGLNSNIGIWSANSFLMNNVSLATRELPKNILDWENFSSVESPFHLSDDNIWAGNNQVNNSAENDRGVIKVERSVARFDFKDGSPTRTAANTYEVLMNTDENGDFDKAQPIVDVEIQKMCLVNMGNKFYYLPRVSKNGQMGTLEEDATNDDGYFLCGREKPWVRNSDGTYSEGNYVVGPWASDFKSPIGTGFSNYFNFPFFEDNGTFNNNAMSTTRWDVVKVSDVLKGTPDTYVKPGEENAEPGQYRVWRYVTENVIPASEDNQVNGISTGVVFKGKLLGNQNVFDETINYYESNWDAGFIKNLANCLNGESFTFNGVTHDKLAGNSTTDPILYYFSGHLYMGWRHMRQAAIQASITINTAGEVEINPSNSLYKAVFGDGPIPPSYTSGKPYYYIDAKGEPHDIKDPRWDSTWKTDGSSTPTGENAELYLAYTQSPNFKWSVWSNDGREEIIDEENGTVSQALIDMRAAVTSKGTSIYQSSVDNDYGPGYYCYYYYWNRHNDNGLNGSMGPMEFDVVRNNVYKLSVNNIARLGHPRIPENDPNNPTPDTPDESDEIYLDVKMEIVPWVVRLNSIEF